MVIQTPDRGLYIVQLMFYKLQWLLLSSKEFKNFCDKKNKKNKNRYGILHNYNFFISIIKK